MRISARSTATVLVLGLLAASATAAAATKPEAGKIVCGRYSSFELAPGETAEIAGAGATSVSMYVKGPKGLWLFYDGLTPAQSPAELGTLVHQGKAERAYRRPYSNWVYVAVPTFKYEVDGQSVFASVSGLDILTRKPYADSAIAGTDADLSIVKRIHPAQQKRCDLRWMPGVGLVAEK